MTQEEILDDRIETLKDRYRKEIVDVVDELLGEKKVLDRAHLELGGISALGMLGRVIDLNAQLRELLYLKDRIANQAREKKPAP